MWIIDLPWWNKVHDNFVHSVLVNLSPFTCFIIPQWAKSLFQLESRIKPLFATYNTKNKNNKIWDKNKNNNNNNKSILFRNPCCCKNLLNTLKNQLSQISSVTFCFHVTVSKNHFPRYNRIKPIIAADRLSSFTRFDFFAWFSGKLRNGAKRN